MITESIITAKTSQMIESLVGKVIVPKFEEFIKSVKMDYKVVLEKNKNCFIEYYNRTYEKYSIVNTLVFHNSQRLLKDIYVPQSLVKDNRFEGREKTMKIEHIPTELIKEYKRIMITDTAGMGKSTILKRMFLDMIDSSVEDIGIPIYIELNRLKANRTILMEIREDLHLSDDVDNEKLLKFIQAGGFVFFMDGYDEIKLVDKSIVINDILSFISESGNKNYFILTSRPEDSLSYFGNFQLFKISPLTKEEAYTLLIKYDLMPDKVIAEKLIELLKSGEYNSIDEYLENPLLVSLLFSAFDHKRVIPLKKHLFYRQVYDAYFDSHDLSKGIEAHQKRSGLDIDDFNRVLRYVGYECLIRIGVRFNKDTILNTIRKAKLFCGNLFFMETDFLKDMLLAVPLFYKEGLEYRWVQKSLMEYFAARFIAEDSMEGQDKILTAIYQSRNIEKYLNMLDIYYDIDYKGFSKNIILPLCERFIRFYDENFFTSNICKNSIEQRISNLFFAKYAFMVSQKDMPRIKYQSLFKQEYLGLENYEFRYFKVKDEFFYYAFQKYGQLSKLTAFFIKKWKYLFFRQTNYSEAFNDLKKNGLPKEFDFFERERVHFVDFRIGEKSEEIYDTIDIIIGIMTDDKGFYYSFDYEACKKEAERIKRDIVQSEGALDLLDGI